MSPGLATRNGRLESVFGTMGGDAQPHILLQLATRLFHHGMSPKAAIDAGLAHRRERDRTAPLYGDAGIGDRRQRSPYGAAAGNELQVTLQDGKIYDAVQGAFKECDILVTPTVAALPVKNATDGNTLGPTRVAGEEVDPLIGWCLTYPINYTGHPAASIPAGADAVWRYATNRHVFRSNILFVDGRVEFVKPAQIASLRWEPPPQQ